MIKLISVNKYFNRHKRNQVHAIDNTSLELEDKGLIALLGPSGCGKTTLLNAIGGLDKVNNGAIFINGKKITKRCSYKVDKIRNLNIGYIFQDYKLLDNMSVFDNVAISLKLIGIKDKKEIKKRVEYILDRVGMYRYRYRLASMLSGGERQRVGIARALVKNPDIILADEPTGNLDSKNTLEVMNIIKSISKDKLVILVTHEVDLAKFYATRIIEVSDGKVVKDYVNDKVDDLDYRIDNKIYLKDFKYQSTLNDNNINIDMYSDNKDKLNLKVVFKNGNIYIESDNKEKIEVIDNNSSVELVDDNYKKINKDIFEQYKFDYDKIINKDLKLRYSSIFNIFTIIKYGFSKVFSYTILKKILLIGFFLSGLFVTYSISNYFGVTNVKEDDFVTVRKNTLQVNDNKVTLDKYNKIKNIDGISYLMPGSSAITFQIETNDFYQTANSYIELKGFLSSIKLLNENDIIAGRMPENNREIVLDKRVYSKNIVSNPELKMVGIYDYKELIGKKLTLIDKLIEYTIVGIVDIDSSSIYVDEGEFLNINFYNTFKDKNPTVFSVNMYKDKITLKSGKMPENDYEVIINEEYKYEYKIGKEINEKVNDHKLKVVGYYTSPYNYQYNFVSDNTLSYLVITNSKNITIYPQDKDKVISHIEEENIQVKDMYENLKAKYLKERKESVKSSVIVALVMLAISMIEIILMSRSSFLSRIKEVGIYRAIGVKKKDIYKMFVGEYFAITTIASLPGILFMSYCLKVMSTIKYIGDNYMINPYIIVLCIILMYVFNILVSLIPVFNTIRKTPANILSRTDI